jgi:hypothetical protein
MSSVMAMALGRNKQLDEHTHSLGVKHPNVRKRDMTQDHCEFLSMHNSFIMKLPSINRILNYIQHFHFIMNHISLAKI